MKYEWDAVKAAVNRRKHGVPFEEAQTVICSPLAITIQDVGHSTREDREKTIGPSARDRLLVVAHSAADHGIVRIISARKASGREIADYEEEIRTRYPAG